VSAAALLLITLTVGGAVSLVAHRLLLCRHWRTHGDRRQARAEFAGPDRRREARRGHGEGVAQ
jgi:hypothetical protein